MENSVWLQERAQGEGGEREENYVQGKFLLHLRIMTRESLVDTTKHDAGLLYNAIGV